MARAAGPRRVGDPLEHREVRGARFVQAALRLLRLHAARRRRLSSLAPPPRCSQASPLFARSAFRVLGSFASNVLGGLAFNVLAHCRSSVLHPGATAPITLEA